MKIGITEQGDAAINFDWYRKLYGSDFDGAVLITKNAHDKFIAKVMDLYSTFPNILLHIGCTGFGKTIFEPNVPEYNVQLQSIQKLIDAGFPADHIVLRCDPIIPTEDGLTRLKNVLDTFVSMNTGITRVRFSIYDEYNHVKARLANVGMKPIYDGSFYTPKEMMENTAKLLASYPDLQFESCAEDELVKTVNLPNIKCCGCVSLNEIKLFGINDDVSKLLENMQNRHGCHCLSCKTELLNERKQCPHKCIYCYWKN